MVAGHHHHHQRQYFDNHTRLNANLNDYRATKLDVQQRNSYNRTNHNRYQSPSAQSQQRQDPHRYQQQSQDLGLAGHYHQPLLPQVVVGDGGTIASTAYDSINHHQQHPSYQSSASSAPHQHTGGVGSPAGPAAILHQHQHQHHQAHHQHHHHHHHHQSHGGSSGGSSSSSQQHHPYAPYSGSSSGGGSSQHSTTNLNTSSGSSSTAVPPPLANHGSSRYGTSPAATEQPADLYWDEPADSRRFTERRKKTVRFDGQDADTDWSRWESERQGSQDSATKDSGIDTSSTFTSSEDSNRGDGPKNPVSWQASSEGGRMIGYMVQRRHLDGDSDGYDLKGRCSAGGVGGGVGVGGSGVGGGLVLPSATRAALLELDSVHIRPENYDRRDKPSVLVTSPGSPDLHSVRNYSSSSRYSNRLAPATSGLPQENSVGGRVQIKLGFEPSSLQLIVTVLCANGLVPRGNGAARNPYVKICLLPDRSEKSKRRTKTLALTNDPRWGQTFVYEGLRRADLNNRLFEVTVWDYVRYGANDFLGEVIIDLSTHPLDDEAEWHILQPHQDSLRDTLRRDDKEPGNELDMILTPTDHLSPPSTTSRLSDSDTTSECDIDGLMTGRDGASVSSLGSSSSPPPEVDLQDRRSRRDMSPQGRKRAAGMVAKDYRTVSGVGQGFHNQMSAEVSTAYRRNGTMAMNQRSQSAAPSDNYRDDRRDSLSPQDDRYTEYPVLPLHQYAPRFQSRSATATPTGSPKKRQLPQVPHMSRNAAIRERFIQDFEERSGGRFARHRGRQSHHQPTYRSTGMGGWERHYSGLSDSDLTTHSLENRIRPRHSLSPDKDFMGDFGDSDMESVVSVTSSAFSTQSERPRGSKGIRNLHNRRLQNRSLPTGWATASLCALPSEDPFGQQFGDQKPIASAPPLNTAQPVPIPAPQPTEFEPQFGLGGGVGVGNIAAVVDNASYGSGLASGSCLGATSDPIPISPAPTTEPPMPLQSYNASCLGPPSVVTGASGDASPMPDMYFSEQCITLNPDSSTIQSVVRNPGSDNMMTTSLNLSSTQPNNQGMGGATSTFEFHSGSLPTENYFGCSDTAMPSGVGGSMDPIMTASLHGEEHGGSVGMMGYRGNTSHQGRRPSMAMRSNTSEPNLNTMIVRRLSARPIGSDGNRHPFGHLPAPTNQLISISNRYQPPPQQTGQQQEGPLQGYMPPGQQPLFAGGGTNQIILRSSCSDQNLQGPGQGMGQNICISNQNVYDPGTGYQNRTVTCIRNSTENLRGESNIRYISNPEGTVCEINQPDMMIRSARTFPLLEDTGPPAGQPLPPMESAIGYGTSYGMTGELYPRDAPQEVLHSPFERRRTSYEEMQRERRRGPEASGYPSRTTVLVGQDRQEKISRSHSLIADDQIIDIEYDSDTGWKTKSVRKNVFVSRRRSSTEVKSYRKRTRSLGYSDGDAEETAEVQEDEVKKVVHPPAGRKSRSGSKSSLDRSNLTLNLEKATEVGSGGSAKKEKQEEAKKATAKRPTKEKPSSESSQVKEKPVEKGGTGGPGTSKPSAMVKSKSTTSTTPKKGAGKSPAKSGGSLKKSGSLKGKPAPKTSKTSTASAPSKGTPSKGKVLEKPKFKEIETKGTKAKLPKGKSDSKGRVDELKSESESAVLYSSTESIKSIIDEVRQELLQKPKTMVYLSDESPTVLNRSHSFSDGELNYGRQTRRPETDPYDPYNRVRHGTSDGRHSGRYNRDNGQPEDREDYYGGNRRRMVPDGEEDDVRRRPDLFPKCKSRSSSMVSLEDENPAGREYCEGSSGAGSRYRTEYREQDRGGSVRRHAGYEYDEGEDYDDEVFESSFSRGRNASFNGKSSLRRRAQEYDVRRTSSLEGIDQFLAKLQEKGRQAGTAGQKSDSARHSSVSINEKPEYFEYTKSPMSPLRSSSSRIASSRPSANSALSSSLSGPKSSNGVALLQTEPKRPSMKKPTTATAPGSATTSGHRSRSNDRHPRSESPSDQRGGSDHHRTSATTTTTAYTSEYDVRGRSRYSGHNGGRDVAYRHRDRERDRERNSSDHERDRELSDREQRETRERAELDQSLSNTEGTPEDKIDGSLSDTAVIQSLDARRKLDQRSPKSETPTRDRDRFGTGMGIKSNSTSQLSATGRKRRMGFGKRGKNSFTVHRSEEVLPGEIRGGGGGLGAGVGNMIGGSSGIGAGGVGGGGGGGLSRGSSASSDGEGSADGDRFAAATRYPSLLLPLLLLLLLVLLIRPVSHPLSTSFLFASVVQLSLSPVCVCFSFSFLMFFFFFDSVS
ncbi:hypothetical protein AND_010395 [Anopheles darlingi]|uniref:C2 domain-containing protein n=1 Tax=Anopheles darlingi TaxID=43151 RepID=W5J1H6_ANODA|nr:hypothetical protein AND_010395 [Anopheles darlingi]